LITSVILKSDVEVGVGLKVNNPRKACTILSRELLEWLSGGLLRGNKRQEIRGSSISPSKLDGLALDNVHRRIDRKTKRLWN